MPLLSDEDMGLRPTGTLDLPGKSKLLSDQDMGIERAEVAGMPRQAAAGFNDYLANVIQGPAALSRLTDGPLSETAAKPFDWLSQSIRALSPPPQGAAGRVARRAGQVVGETLPYAAMPFMAPVAGPAINTAQRVAQTIAKTSQGAPGRTALAELAGATGSGIGSGIAREKYPDNNTAEALAMLAGGLVTTLPMALGRATAAVGKKLPLVGTGIRAARATLLPFTEAGAMSRASSRLQALAGDPVEAAKRLRETPISDLSPAQITGDKRLLALERAILDADAQLDDQFAGATREASKQLLDALKKTAPDVPIANARKAVQSRSDYLTDLLEHRAKQAGKEAEQLIARLAPELRESEASKIVREEIETALGQARAQANDLWDKVPKDVVVNTNNAVGAFDDLLARTSQAQMEDIPEIASSLLNRESNHFLGAKNTINEVWGLRSKLLEEARGARAAGKANTARIADDLADALLDDLGARAGAIKGQAGEDLNLALDFSRTVAERFKQGAVGKILGRERAGGQSVAPDMTLRSSIGSGGPGGEVAARQITAAAPTDATEEGVRQFLLGRFNRSVVRSGKIDTNRAQSFVTENADLLDRYPQMREDMLASGTAQDFAELTARHAQKLTQSVTQKNKSVTADFLQADVDTEIDAIFKAANPAKAAHILKNMVAKEPSGRASKGLEASVVDFILRRATRDFDEAGNAVLSGKALLATLKNQKFRAGSGQILPPGAMQRLERIAREMQLIERSQGRLPGVGDVINDANILQTAVRMLGAKAGRALNTGTIQVPGIAAERAKTFLRGMTNDKARELLIKAASDKELYYIILKDMGTPKGQKEVLTRLNAWLITTGQEFFEGE